VQVQVLSFTQVVTDSHDVPLYGGTPQRNQ
jgi:hypothetical protein